MIWKRTSPSALPVPSATERRRPRLAPVVPVPAGTLELRGVAKQFSFNDNRRAVLDGIDLKIEPGEFVCIVGPSGCGKSTLLRLISGLDVDYEGEILLDGRLIAGPDLDRGIVFQDHRLFPWMTIEENVGLALLNSAVDPERRAKAVSDHLALVGLAEFAKARPDQLSGGMAQRAAIARGLVNEPRILLLDEPFGALDALTRLRMQQELQRIWLKQRSTMIMVTHDVDEAVHLASRVIVMAANPGRVVDILSPDAPYPRDWAGTGLQPISDAILRLIMREEN